MERLPCDPERECKYRDTDRGCYEDIDHYYFPRKNYRDSVSKAFRELVVNKTVTCRALHDERHATQSPPPKPSRNEMLAVLQQQQGEVA